MSSLRNSWLSVQNIVLIILACAAGGLTADYYLVRSQESKILGIASDLGGRCVSIPLWPLGTEYKIHFQSNLTLAQVKTCHP